VVPVSPVQRSSTAQLENLTKNRGCLEIVTLDEVQRSDGPTDFWHLETRRRCDGNCRDRSRSGRGRLVWRRRGVEAWSVRLFALCGGAIFVTSWVGYGASRLVGDDRFVEVWAIGTGLTTILIRQSAKTADVSFTPDSRRSSSLRVWTFYALIAYASVGAGFAAATSPDPVKFGPISAIGIAICSVGLLIALMTTVQRLKAVRLDQFACSGLWRWSRHTRTIWPRRPR